MNDFTKEELLEFLEYYNAWSCFTTTEITNGNNTPTIILDAKDVVRLFGMNDFTKQELNELLISLSCRFSRELGQETKEHLEFSLGLELKIQSMIDNYCAHAKVVPSYDVKTQCDNCGEIL